MLLIDADGAVAGRLAAFVAKKALSGETVIIVNAEKAVISGDPKYVIKKYFNRRSVQNKANPEKSGKTPRRPDLFLKKMIGGMIPKSPRGAQAEKAVKAFLGVPHEYEGKKADKPVKTAEKLGAKFITLKQLCIHLGWNKTI
jgi:large subunit ribosomal protein L13